jgi:hypothetical protein
MESSDRLELACYRELRFAPKGSCFGFAMEFL